MRSAQRLAGVLAGLSLVIGVLAPVTRSEAAVTTAGEPVFPPVAWGDNQSGQLGDGTRETRTQAVAVFGLRSVRTVTAGAEHTLALGFE